MTSIASAFGTAVGAMALNSLAAQIGQLLNFGGRLNVQPGTVDRGGAFKPAAPAFEAKMGAEGKASVDLGDGYTLDIDEKNSEIVVKDADGNVTKIWGDPHFEYNGKHVGDFWGTTTLVLENGTKVTINTEPFGNNPNAFVASEVVVTRGAQALTIGGVSQNQLGDLSLEMSNGGGRRLDAANDDGLVIREGAGKDGGWVSSLTGDKVGQGDFDYTKPGMEGAREALEWSNQLSSSLGSWLLLGSLTGLFALGAVAELSSSPKADAIERLFPRLR